MCIKGKRGINVYKREKFNSNLVNSINTILQEKPCLMMTSKEKAQDFQ